VDEGWDTLPGSYEMAFHYFLQNVPLNIIDWL
jgi:hypothetical protein